MENLNQAQQNRIKMFEKMGVKHAGQMVSETAVAGGAQNMSMLQKIQQIKSGAAKSELNKYVKATGKGANSSAPGAVGFDPIPVNKPRKNPNMPQQSVDSNYKVDLANFGGSGPSTHIDNSELSMIDAMFAGTGSPSMGSNYDSFESGQAFIPQNSYNTQVDLSSTLNNMPSFNPQHAIQRAMNKSSQNNQQTQQNSNSFLQFAQNSEPAMHEAYLNQNNQSLGITPAMKLMMESIAKTMAEQTIKRVLTEFTDNQKSKTYFEVYNKEKSVIKTADGKLYKLTPVQVKR